MLGLACFLDLYFVTKKDSFFFQHFVVLLSFARLFKQKATKGGGVCDKKVSFFNSTFCIVVLLTIGFSSFIEFCYFYELF